MTLTVAMALMVTAIVVVHWLAGYGIGVRLEFLMIPIIFDRRRADPDGRRRRGRPSGAGDPDRLGKGRRRRRSARSG
ncbi:MAG: hypothetical protein ACMVO3_00040 [Thalassobaculum sp.]